MSYCSDPCMVQRAISAMRERGSARLRVFGSSMVPWIRPGDVLFARQVDARAVSRGEVVVFQRNGLIVAHRVVRKFWAAAQAILITKGDAVADPDTPVSASEFLGRVTCIYRGGRWVDAQTLSHKALGIFMSRAGTSSRFLYSARRLAVRSLWRLIAES